MAGSRDRTRDWFAAEPCSLWLGPHTVPSRRAAALLSLHNPAGPPQSPFGNSNRDRPSKTEGAEEEDEEGHQPQGGPLKVHDTTDQKANDLHRYRRQNVN